MTIVSQMKLCRECLLQCEMHFHILNYLILVMTLWSSYDYFPHCMDGETEARSSQSANSGSVQI